MNIDHADSLLAFAHYYLPREMGVNRAEMTDATPEGIHMRVFTKNDNGEGKKVFIPYPAGHNVSHAGCLRKVIVAMHAEALEGLGHLGVARVKQDLPDRVRLPRVVLVGDDEEDKP